MDNTVTTIVNSFKLMNFIVNIHRNKNSQYFYDIFQSQNGANHFIAQSEPRYAGSGYAALAARNYIYTYMYNTK